MAVFRSQFKVNLFPVGKSNLLRLCQPLPVRGQPSPLYTMPHWSCHPHSVVSYLLKARLHWNTTHVGYHDALVRPLFSSLAGLSPSLGEINWWSLQLCPFLSSDLSKAAICSNGEAKSEWPRGSYNKQTNIQTKNPTTPRCHFGHFYWPAQLPHWNCSPACPM